MNQVWTRRQTLWAIAGAAGGLALHACAPSQQPSQDPSQQKLTTASIGLFTWVGSAPLYIARDKGFFQNLGLNLEVKVFAENTDANAAFVSDRLNAVSPVTSEAVSLAANGADFRIVMVQDSSVGGDGILARNSIADISDFKGKKIAVEEGSVSHFFLLQVMAEAGLEANDFTLVNAGPDIAATAYRSGQVEIAVTYAPHLSKANREQPDGRIIYDSARMPTAIADLYVFNTEFLETNPQAADAFVRGVLQGLEFLKTNRAEGLAIASSALGISPEELEDGLLGVRLPDLAANLEMLANPESNLYLLKSMESLAKFLKERKQIQQIPDLSKLIEPKFIQAI